MPQTKLFPQTIDLFLALSLSLSTCGRQRDIQLYYVFLQREVPQTKSFGVCLCLCARTCSHDRLLSLHRLRGREVQGIGGRQHAVRQLPSAQVLPGRSHMRGLPGAGLQPRRQHVHALQHRHLRPHPARHLPPLRGRLLLRRHRLLHLHGLPRRHVFSGHGSLVREHVLRLPRWQILGCSRCVSACHIQTHVCTQTQCVLACMCG
jgi:hypothetical protein